MKERLERTRSEAVGAMSYRVQCPFAHFMHAIVQAVRPVYGLGVLIFDADLGGRLFDCHLRLQQLDELGALVVRDEVVLSPC